MVIPSKWVLRFNMNLGQIQLFKAADSGHRTVKQNEADRLGQDRRRFTGQQLSEDNVPGTRDKECMIQRWVTLGMTEEQQRKQ